MGMEGRDTGIVRVESEIKGCGGAKDVVVQRRADRSGCVGEGEMEARARSAARGGVGDARQRQKQGLVTGVLQPPARDEDDGDERQAGRAAGRRGLRRWARDTRRGGVRFLMGTRSAGDRVRRRRRRAAAHDSEEMHEGARGRGPMGARWMS